MTWKRLNGGWSVRTYPSGLIGEAVDYGAWSLRTLEHDRGSVVDEGACPERLDPNGNDTLTLEDAERACDEAERLQTFPKEPAVNTIRPFRLEGSTADLYGELLVGTTTATLYTETSLLVGAVILADGVRWTVTETTRTHGLETIALRRLEDTPAPLAPQEDLVDLVRATYHTLLRFGLIAAKTDPEHEVTLRNLLDRLHPAILTLSVPAAHEPPLKLQAWNQRRRLAWTLHKLDSKGNPKGRPLPPTALQMPVCECGHRLFDKFPGETLTSYPPQSCVVCAGCGFHGNRVL